MVGQSEWLRNRMVYTMVVSTVDRDGARQMSVEMMF